MTAMVGSIIALQKIRVSPDAAFSVNDWTAFVIFIVVIGGIGTIEGPIVGTLVYFLLREFLADLGSIYLLFLGALAIVIMLVAPKGIWGYVAAALEHFAVSDGLSCAWRRRNEALHLYRHCRRASSSGAARLRKRRLRPSALA